uniref:Uncharacterized protein n=1 Tax=Aegilops tauschii subsp. strangulata TaxID=200361 RepID=A0A452XWM3_AEGTS
MWRARRWPRPRWFSSDTAAVGADSGNPARRRVAALWGNGDHGRLGLGALESRWSPTACPFFLTRPADPPTSLACGGAHTLFLTEGGRVFATGLNDFGQLGIGSSMPHTLVISPHIRVLPVTGFSFTCRTLLKSLDFTRKLYKFQLATIILVQ